MHSQMATRSRMALSQTCQTEKVPAMSQMAVRKLKAISSRQRRSRGCSTSCVSVPQPQKM